MLAFGATEAGCLHHVRKHRSGWARIFFNVGLENYR